MKEGFLSFEKQELENKFALKGEWKL